MKRLLEEVKGFMALLSFLTIIPTGVHDLALASRSFYLAPIIGLIEGLIVVAPIFLGTLIHVKAALILTISYLITGFSHLDGFADFADALGSGRSGESALRIMKGPGRGAVAIAATILLIIATYSSLIELIAKAWWHVITLSHVLASESMYLLALVSTPPGYHGLSRSFILGSRHRLKVVANLLILGIILFIITSVCQDAAYYQLAAIVSMILIVACTRVKSHEMLGFVNGDVLGFCYELTKGVLLVLLAALVTL